MTSTEKNKPTTGVCLFSGGLDSRLAARLILDQGINLTALHFASVYMPADVMAENVSSPEEAAAHLGMTLKVVDISAELTELVKAPPHGHGSGLNPCIDCRILQLRKAASLMEETGSSFIVTGEVSGQRPMTQQKNMMRHIEREAGVESRVLRPLSALILEPTLPEKRGLVERGKLCDFSGRQRTPQISLARKLGIDNYPAPAGGCRLTEPGYARRLKDLLDHDELHGENASLIKYGRHFRLSTDTRLIVGREESENEKLQKLATPDSDILLESSRHAGPTSLLIGQGAETQLENAARITARYGKGRDKDEIEITATGRVNKQIRVKPAGRNEFKDLLV